MPSPPSSAVAGAAVAAVALADVLEHLARTIPVSADTARGSLQTARLIARVQAPRLETREDAARIAAALVASIQALARDAVPADAAAGLYVAASATQACTPISASPVLTQAYGLARAIGAGVEAACLGEAFLAEARSDLGDRQATAEARARITAALDSAVDRIAAALGQAAAVILTTAAGQCCAHLADLAGNLQPLVQVATERSFPSTALAWSLYRDPNRAPEIVARNRVATPFHCPATFEALAPKRST